MEQIFEAMEKMFQVANIIHGDFSEFNILYFQRRVWVIDVSQVRKCYTDQEICIILGCYEGSPILSWFFNARL